jgi:hypothetical protein
MWFSLSLESGRGRRKEVDVSKTTYILIPGAGGDAWYWHLLTDHLEVRGHEVAAVSLPASDDSAGWAEYADTIVGAIGDRNGVMLVAQSLGGFSAPLACARVPVELLVLVNAMIPRPGETGAEWWSNTGQREAMHTQLGALGLPPESADDDATIYFHDVSPEVSAQAFERGEPTQSWTPMTQPWPVAAGPTCRRESSSVAMTVSSPRGFSGRSRAIACRSGPRRSRVAISWP